ncbi:MAG: hypothetical protein K2O05_00250 [Anaeroplasmataceae bacterium]|nr:hypothetical protein [Anaeroplasmataceae bacterium]MDE5867584.1 hypothetical protein [Anaeroplasmataceae bacterium]MDE7100267.1 hypothetical protein [Anaeroplasmataceae bacterium]
MNFTGSNFNSCGCGNRDSGCGCPTNTPTYQQCNQVVQTCNVEDIPHYTNYHTHVVNNCVKRHINIPTYSTSSENVMIDEYVQGQPIYQQPMMYSQPMMYQQPIPQQGQYQGNVGTEGLTQQMQNYGPQGFQGVVPPMGNIPFGY